MLLATVLICMSENALGKATSGTSATDKDSSVECRVCSKEYDSRQGLKYHYKTDTTECSGHECPECGVNHYLSPEGVRIHLAREHDIELSSIEELNDPDWIREKYHEEGLTLSEIGELCGCVRNAVLYWMEKHEIERRESGRERADERLYDEEWFRQKYIEEGYSTTEIAEICDCSGEVTREWKRKHGIESITDYKSRGTGEDNPMWADNTVEAECAYCGSDMEIREYRFEKAENNFCNPDCHAEYVTENRVGENHPLYEGGPQDYGQGWHRARKKARERDNCTCQRCGRHEDELDNAVEVHHLRRVRSFDDPSDAHFLENLVCLCVGCHANWEGIPLRPDRRER